jgi:hypothetical protein
MTPGPGALAWMVVGNRVSVDVVAETAAGVTVTGAVCVIATPLMVTETVFPSATVELKVPVTTPLPFVVPDGVIVLPPPLAEKTTLADGIKFARVSRAVTVTVD